jgi:WD40 repeat protein
MWWNALGEQRPLLSLPAFPIPVCDEALFSKDGTKFITVNSLVPTSYLRVFETSTGAELMAFEAHGEVTSLAASDDARTLAVGMYDGSVHMWDLDARSVTRKIEVEDWAQTIALSPSGDRLLTWRESTLGRRGRLRLWDVSTGRVLRTFPERGGEWHATFLPDGSRFVASWRCFGQGL